MQDSLFELTMEQLRVLYERREVSCRQLVEYYISRIESVDLHTNSVLEVNPDALSIADDLDKRYDEMDQLPLYGVPILLKDNVYTHDGMHTSAGSLLLEDWAAPFDAYAVSKLRAAGAILLGKANMTEWANFMSDNMSAGYSSRGGQVVNPYGDFFVGGSSSGSAAAVAANFAMAAIGSETSGSIISPAANNSIVGIKPTVGLVSRFGVIPLSITQDTLGPMARTVMDAAVLLEVISGEDASDPYTQLSHRPIRFIPGKDPDASRVYRVGVPASIPGSDPDMVQLFEQSLGELEAAGIEVVTDIDMPGLQTDWDHEVLRYEFKTAINEFLSQLPPSIPARDLTSLIAYHKEHPELFLKYGQSVFEWVDEISGSLEDPVYLESKAKNLERAGAQGIDYALSTYRLDAIVYPENTGSDLAARVGYPLVTVPAGYYGSGRPLGITFSGTACSEALLIQIAYLYETHTKHRKPPVMSK